MSRTYWRSQRQIDGHPEFLEMEQREFPEGASEPPDGFTRREMVTLLGASLSLAGLASCRRPEHHIVPYVDPPETVIPGIPRHYATTLPVGRQALGLVVESHEGRPTKVEGNTLHPATLGASNVRTQSAILDLYDPDRSQTVRQAGQPKSWADFVAAWGTLEKDHLAGGGAGLAVLSGMSSSPTMARLRAAFMARFPKATWTVAEPVSDENVLAGTTRVAGRPLDTVLAVDRARVIVALDADLFGAHADAIRNMRGFAEGRRAGATGGAMNRLYAVEAVHSLTGAMADHRLRLRSSRVAAFLVELAKAAGVAGDAAGGATPNWFDAKMRAFVDAAAGDLRDARGAGLLVAGDRQPAEVHAAVAALNAALGNAGATVSYRETAGALLPTRADLAALAAAMRAGSVKTLVVLGGNPAYDAPADLDFAAALGKVPNVIALTDQVDETARLAAWHLPRAHAFEAWGDARALGGPLSVVQPLILPLYGGRSEVEIAALLATGKETPGYDLVRETWKPILGANFETTWGKVLESGLFAGSELPATTFAPNGRALSDLTTLASSGAAKAGDGSYEIVFMASPAVHDGRFANNGWLQELPDPITKQVWDNPALLSPATAKGLGVADEQVIKIDLGGRSVELPVHVLPGLEDGTVAVTLGYGRTAAGRVGDHVGTDLYRLRPSGAPDIAPGAVVARTSQTRPLATTQEHGSMEGRPLILEASLEQFRREPASITEHEREVAAEGSPLFTERTYTKGPQWAMTIDLNTCVGCNACVVACQSENNVPVVGKDQVRRGRQMHWLRIDRYFEGDPEGDVATAVQPVPCMQCENAPCEQVCPVAATVHDNEGLNVMVYNRCIGTRYCSNNCPYKVRRFNFYNFTKDTPESLRLAQNPDVTVRSRGVMEKCTYCVQRINSAKIDSRLSGRPLKDGDIKTACQEACPAQAITFGDLFDAESRVSQHRKDPRNYEMLAELRAKPRTTYLAKLRNPHPALAAAAPAGGEHGDETHG